MILNNPVKGRPACSFSSQDEAQDVPEPVPREPSPHNSAAENVKKIQQICEKKNETVREQIKRIADPGKASRVKKLFATKLCDNGKRIPQ